MRLVTYSIVGAACALGILFAPIAQAANAPLCFAIAENYNKCMRQHQYGRGGHGGYGPGGTAKDTAKAIAVAIPAQISAAIPATMMAMAATADLAATAAMAAAPAAPPSRARSGGLRDLDRSDAGQRLLQLAEAMARHDCAAPAPDLSHQSHL